MDTIRRIATHVLISIFATSLAFGVGSPAEDLAEYNVRWDEPSKHAGESMPCGGGDIGLNVWVEDGSIVFYMQRSGSYDKNGQYMKLGRVRVTLSPNPLLDGERFLQELDLPKGHVETSGTKSIPGQGEVSSKAKIWVDTSDSTIHFTCESNKDTKLKVEYENWRHEERTFSDSAGYGGSFAIFEIGGKPGTYHTAKDSFEAGDQQLLFYHRNPETTIVDLYIEQQGMGDYREQIHNDLSRRTFGGVLYGEGLQKIGNARSGDGHANFTYGSSRPSTRSHFAIATHIAQTETLEA